MIAAFEYCGLGVSATIVLPELDALESDRSIDLRVVIPERTLPRPESWVHHWVGSSGITLSLGRVDGRHVLRFEDGSFFDFDPDTRTIGLLTPRKEAVRRQLLDHVLPRVFDHLGNLMIHGSAINTRSGSVVFIGDSGHGKSTLAASFQNSGVDLLSDDCVRLTNDSCGGVDCMPTYRSLRLWPDSAASVMSCPSFELISSDSDKHRLHLSAKSAIDPGKVAVIFVLATPSDGVAIRFSPLPPAQAVSHLLAQCFRLDPTDADATKRAFERCADVAERVPVVELSYPRDYDRLSEVREAVLDRSASGDWATITAR